MEALVLIENAFLEYKEVDMPKRITRNSYLINVVAAGICGSDIYRAFLGKAYHYPLIMGHEFSGIIEETFPEAKYKKGQRVTIYPLIPCKKCRACQTGNYAQCSNYNYLGSRCNGGFADYVYVPEENIIPIPEDVDIIHAAMTEPCAVALHGVRKLKIKAGETAVVYGAGPIGNVVAQWLNIRGCSKIIVIDIDNKKLEIAKSMGFTPINSKNIDPVSTIYNLTDNEGADKVVEACGLPLTYRQAVLSAGRFSEILFLGNISDDFILRQDDFTNILRKEISIYGTWNSKIVPTGKDDWNTVLKFMDKQLNVAPIISHTPLLKDGAEIFIKIVSKKEFFNKVIFKLGSINS